MVQSMENASFPQGTEFLKIERLVDIIAILISFIIDFFF